MFKFRKDRIHFLSYLCGTRKKKKMMMIDDYEEQEAQEVKIEQN